MKQRPSISLSAAAALIFAGSLPLAHDLAAPAHAKAGPPERVEQQIEQAVERATERAAERAADRITERAAERALEKAAEKAVEKAADIAAERAAHGMAKAAGKAHGKGASAVVNGVPANGQPEQDAAAFRETADDNGHGIVFGEMLLLVDQQQLAALADAGVHIIWARELPGLDLLVARVSTLGSPNIEGILDAADGSEFTVDSNHIYRPGAEGGAMFYKPAHAPGDYLDLSNGTGGMAVKIGMIDTAIDIKHKAFANARIMEKEFVAYARERSLAHGTAVASVLVGRSAGYRGLIPQAELYSASVFFKDDNGDDVATTASLIEALDWLAAANVPVINMSLTGPPNAVLKKAIETAWRKGIIVIAAAGNSGPAAEPMFPAAYEEVVSVTAIDDAHLVYRLANRGDYVDFSAPGVNILCASRGGGYEIRSGTSIAAPFAAAILAEARARPLPHPAPAALLGQMRDNAQDLGENGFDPVYGYGLIRRFPTL